MEAPWLHSLSNFSIDLHSGRMSISSIITEVRVDILVIEVFNTLLIRLVDKCFLLFFSCSV